MIDLATVEELERQAVLVALGLRAIHGLATDLNLKNEIAPVATAAAGLRNQLGALCEQLAANGQTPADGPTEAAVGLSP